MLSENETPLLAWAHIEWLYPKEPITLEVSLDKGYCIKKENTC